MTATTICQASSPSNGSARAQPLTYTARAPQKLSRFTPVG
jgi:hypothetical protein